MQNILNKSHFCNPWTRHYFPSFAKRRILRKLDRKALAEPIVTKDLVGAVEEGKEMVLLHEVGYLGPLLPSGVHAGGVVCACVEDDHRMLGSCRQVGQHTAAQVRRVGF
jgi:hypothetical protein